WSGYTGIYLIYAGSASSVENIRWVPKIPENVETGAAFAAARYRGV
ncbi:hypothetical protein Tco_1511898, partial [Tanacetum coccineum]